MGNLPSARQALRATLVNNIIHVSGGVEINSDGDHQYLTHILSWDPENESWEKAGYLAVGRDLHAAVAVPAINVASYCAK